MTRFLGESLDWIATDYRRRTVEEIPARGGGNCAELAQVTVAFLEELALTMRRVREINLHEESPRPRLDRGVRPDHGTLAPRRPLAGEGP